MSVVLSILGQDDVHQPANRLIEGVGIGHFKIALFLADLDVPIVAITDGPLSPLSSLTETRCELDVPAVGPFDSSVPAVIAAELLVSQVVTELGDEALNRIDRLEVFWQATDTFLVTSPPTKP